MPEFDPTILTEWITDQGLKVIQDEALSRKLPINPDILAEGTAKHICAFYFRVSNTIPEIILQRFSKMEIIRSYVLDVYIVFQTRISKSTLEQCIINGVGVLISNSTGCKVLNNPEKKGAIAKVEALGKKPKMEETHLFFSSKQEFEERKIGIKTIELIRNSLRRPIFAKLVEDDQRYAVMSATKLNELITICLNEADYIVCILGTEHRPIVEWEVREALSIIDLEKVILFLKASKEAKEAWAHVITFINFQYKAKGRTVKYIEYVDERDFEIKFHERILRLLNTILGNMGLKLIEV